MGIGYLVDNRDVGFLMADEDRNISLLAYLPEDKYSQGGQRLVPKGDINIGARVNAFARLQSHCSDPVVEDKAQTVHRYPPHFPGHPLRWPSPVPTKGRLETGT